MPSHHSGTIIACIALLLMAAAPEPPSAPVPSANPTPICTSGVCQPHAECTNGVCQPHAVCTQPRVCQPHADCTSGI